LEKRVSWEMKKIWMITEIYYPVKTSTGYYMTEIAEYLASKDIEVHVITTNSIYQEGEENISPLYEKFNGVHIHRIKASNLNKNAFIKRLFRLLFNSYKLYRKAGELISDNESLLTVTNPAFILLLLKRIVSRKSLNYYVLVHDVFPENLVAIKKLSSDSCVYKFLKTLFDSAYKKANVCISIGRDMATILQNKIGRENKIVTIPIWSQNEEVFPISKKDTQTYKELNLSKFIFQFAGNMGHAQGLDNILKAIDLIDNKEVRFLFIGGGAKADEIRNYAEKNENVVSIGFQDRSKQNDFLNACDVAIVTLSDGMYGLGVPSKSYNIMAAGKPILYIGEENSEIALCIKEYNLGWVVEPNNPDALKKQIESIYVQRNDLDEIKRNARYVAEKVFAKKIVLEKYYELFNN